MVRERDSGVNRHGDLRKQHEAVATHGAGDSTGRLMRSEVALKGGRHGFIAVRVARARQDEAETASHGDNWGWGRFGGAKRRWLWPVATHGHGDLDTRAKNRGDTTRAAHSNAGEGEATGVKPRRGICKAESWQNSISDGSRSPTTGRPVGSHWSRRVAKARGKHPAAHGNNAGGSQVQQK